MRIFKKIHEVLEEGCYPLDPMIIYIFGTIAVVYSIFQILS